MLVCPALFFFWNPDALGEWNRPLRIDIATLHCGTPRFPMVVMLIHARKQHINKNSRQFVLFFFFFFRTAKNLDDMSIWLLFSARKVIEGMQTLSTDTPWN